MPSQKSSSTTTTQPWAQQQPYLTYGFSEANRLYGSGAPQYYPGSTVAQFSPFQNAALNLTGKRASQGNPTLNAGGNYLTNVLEGDYLTDFGSRLDPIFRDVEARVIPSAMSAYTKAGRTPGGAGSYGGVATEALTRAYAPIAANLYEGERGRMQAAAGLAPTYAQSDYYDLDRLYDAGSKIQQQNQANIQDSVNRWNYYQQLPWDQLQRYLGSVQGNYGGTTTQPYYSNPFLQGAGGLGSLLGGIGAVFSNSAFKEDIEDVDTKSALDKLLDLDVSEWQYIGDDQRHVGPMAEDFAAVTGKGDGITINLQDEIGLLMASVQELAHRLEAA